MKKYFTLLVFFFLVPVSVFAQDSRLSGSMSLKTGYLVSTGELICDKPVLQADIVYTLDENISFGIWGSTDNDSNNPSCGKEVDYFLNAYGFTVARYDIGKIGASDIDINTISYSHDFGSFSASAQYFDPMQNETGFDLRLGYQATDSFSASLSAGELPFSKQSYLAFEGNYNFEWKSISFDITASHAFNGAENQKENFIVSATYFW